MSNKYDKAIEYLTEHPEAIHTAWVKPYSATGGDLFKCIESCCGRCLTQVRNIALGYGADLYDDERIERQDLWDQIAADERIPYSPEGIQVTDLPVFAEWQRKLDAMENKS